MPLSARLVTLVYQKQGDCHRDNILKTGIVTPDMTISRHA
jgi:hypothetical protein